MQEEGSFFFLVLMCCILLLFSCYLVNQQCAYICTYVCVFVVAGGTIQECSTPAMCLENASPWLPRSPSMGLVNTCCCPPSADTAHTTFHNHGGADSLYMHTQQLGLLHPRVMTYNLPEVNTTYSGHFNCLCMPAHESLFACTQEGCFPLAW